MLWEGLTCSGMGSTCIVHTAPNLQLELGVRLEARNGSQFNTLGSGQLSVVAEKNGTVAVAAQWPSVRLAGPEAVLRLTVDGTPS